MVPALGGDDRLLNPGEKVLAFRKGQTEIREIAEITRAIDLQHVDAAGRIFCPALHQAQNPSHSGSPARETPGQSYPVQHRTPKLSTVPMGKAANPTDVEAETGGSSTGLPFS